MNRLPFLPGKQKFLPPLALLLAGAAVLAWTSPPTPAFPKSRYSMTAFLHCTREQAILKAFTLMADSQGEPSLNRILQKPIRVIFKDMKALNKGLKNYDALSWISTHGEQVIFIHEKHRAAPPEALAAMIAHEAMHEDEYNSLSEEVASWKSEARIWQEMKARNPELAKIPPGTNALVDRENRIEQEYSQGTLESFVRSRPGYAGLPETSPGFQVTSALNP